jgi:hypothetical protein
MVRLTSEQPGVLLDGVPFCSAITRTIWLYIRGGLPIPGDAVVGPIMPMIVCSSVRA